MQQFLVAVQGDAAGSTPGSAKHNLQQQTYLRYIRQKISTLRTSRFDEKMNTASSTGQSGLDGIFTLLMRVANCIRETHHFSIEKAIDSCLRCGILSPAVANNREIRDKARVILFTCTAWISMLYPPMAFTETWHTRLAIDPAQCACILHSQPSTNASRPICEVIQEFGPLLPTGTTELQDTGDPIFSKELLYVSLLNAKALSQIGGIEIVWIDHLSSHLVFDAESRKLFMFRLPSFCYINRYQNSAFAK